MKIKQVVLLYLTAIWLMPFCFAQTQDIKFTSITPKDGLSSNSVNAILKDRFGIMWFATEDGLNKYDGTNVTVYRHKAEDTTSLQANDIRALHEDKAGNLWVGSAGGALSLYDRKNNSFNNFPVNQSVNGLSHEYVRSIYSDHIGKIWIGCYNGLNILDPATRIIEKFTMGSGHAGTLPNTVINCLFEDSKCRMWVGTNDGLFLYNSKTKLFLQFINSNSDSLSLSSNIVKAITEDKDKNIWVATNEGLNMFRPEGKGFKILKNNPNNDNTLNSSLIYTIASDNNDGKLWIGTDKGLNILDVKTGTIKKYKHDERNIYSLSGKSINSIYIDKQGIYWVAPYRGGINKFDENLNLFDLKASNIFDEHGLYGSIVTSFAEDKNGNLFVGTDRGKLNLFNRKTDLFQHFDMEPKDKSSVDGISIIALEMAKSNKLYVGTFSYGLFVLNPITGTFQQFQRGTNPENLNSNDIYSIKEDSKGKIWIGTNGSGINILNADNKVITKYCKNPKAANEFKLPLNGYIRDFEEDREGNMWIGSYGTGIAVFTPANNLFTVYNKRNSTLPSDGILSILADSKNNIWVATVGGGLSLFDRKSKHFVTYSEKDGLQGNYIYKILEDKNGEIWVSTTKGISSFDPTTNKFNNYTIYNGIQNENFVRGAGFLSSDGEVYFGGAGGFNYFNPSFLKKNTNVPAVIFTDLRVSNNSVSPSKDGIIQEHISVVKEINLDYKQNFALDFVSVNYTAPGQNQYAYKLEGFDKDWINAGTTKTASYTNLNPGNYVFRVRASNNDGIWNVKDTSIKIHVKPPFWFTVYAFILYVLIFFGSLFYIRRRGIQKLKRGFALEQERIKATQDIEQERQQAEQARGLDRMKIKFLTNLSHEFRTPISLIAGPVDQLISKEKNEKSFGQLQMIKRNSRRLLNLVNQLLDFRKMEEHELKLHQTPGELISFIHEVTDSFKDLSERKNIHLSFNSSIDKLNTVFDNDKIERIMFNLLSNAFKFTEEKGMVSVDLSEAPNRIAPSMTWLSIKVTDNGIGIPSDKKEKIFERFFQNDTAVSILNQGTGIGLSITQEFVKMQGGAITVESEQGNGATFIVTIPFPILKIPEQNNHEGLRESGKETSVAIIEPQNAIIDIETAPVVEEIIDNNLPQNKTDLPSILLIEDNEDFRFYLKDNLKQCYKIFEAANGKEGWQEALAHHPQLIVSDINMPYMDGIELSRKIKGDKRTSHIPIILLTALTGEFDQIKGLETGANDFITKPFNFEVLNAKIKNLLQLNNTLKNTYTKQIKVTPSNVHIESDDEKLLNTVILYLEENLINSQLSVEDLSKHLAMSRSALYHKLLKLSGETPVEYIRNFKLNKAAVLLEKSDMNIAQIAYSTGFSTPNYFAKLFKAKFEILPSEYIIAKRKAYEIKK